MRRAWPCRAHRYLCPMDHRTTLRSLTIACLFPTLGTALHAQDKSASGHLLNWTNTIVVETDSLVNGRYKLPAHTFTVWEADPGTALNALKAAYAEQGAKFSGSSPLRGMATVAGMGEAPVLLLATTAKDKKAGGARMQVAFAANDSTALPGGGEAAHALAVQVNRAIVQQQIDAQQKIVDKHHGRLEGAQKDQAKAQEKAGKAAEDLEKAKKEKSRLTDKHTQLQKEELKLKERYNATQEAKDLEKLTKMHNKLVKVQEDLAKQIRKEADAQESHNKRQGAIPEAQEAQQGHQVSKEQAVSELEALKRKLEAVR